MDQDKINQNAWENPGNWIGPKWLCAYYSKEDTRDFVPKRVPWMGLWLKKATPNFARPAGVLFFLLILLMLAGAILAFAVPAKAEPAPMAPEGQIAAEAEEQKTYDKPYIGEMKTHIAQYEDTLIDVARANKLGFVEMRAANPFVDPWLPGEGVELVLPTMHLLPDAPHEGIVINLPEMRLYAYIEDGEPPVTYPIGIGREGLQTPVGQTKIVRKKIGPTWRPTVRMREENPDLPVSVAAGPENPLGTHALYFDWPEYAIHGTNKPFGIGRRVSSGCIRMYPEDIVTFYKQAEINMRVTIVDQPVKAAWIDGNLYIEAHPTMEQADAMEQLGGVPDYRLSKSDMAMIVKIAGESIDKVDWSVVRKVIRARNGYPVIVAERSRRLETNSKPKPGSSDRSDERDGASQGEVDMNSDSGSLKEDNEM